MKKASMQCALYLMLYYSIQVFYQGFLSKFYQQQGISGTPLMLLLVSAPLVAVFALPVWGTFSDRSRKRRRVLQLALLIALIIMPCLYLSASPYVILPLICVFGGCYIAVQPMGDSLILEKLQSENQPFGPVRLAGCLTFACVNLIGGILIKDDYSLIPLIVSVGIALVLLGTRLLPDLPGHQQSGKKLAFSKVLKLPHIIPVLLLMMIMQMCLGYFYSYYSIYFTSLPGGSSGLLGLAYFLSASSETPFLLWGHKLFKRWGAGRLMLISAASLALRFLLLGVAQHAYLALASQVLHGLGFIVFTVSTSQYVSRVAPDELKTSAQMLLSVAGFGLARVPGILFGGMLGQYFGGEKSVFLVLSVICLAALITFIPIFFKLPPLNGETE
ncbi:MAG: MFS transporter [Clostridia bacterium]|nr:MFS transporter [Clostridia bacterium]